MRLILVMFRMACYNEVDGKQETVCPALISSTFRAAKRMRKGVGCDMKQFQFVYRNPVEFAGNLMEFKERGIGDGAPGMMFQVYSEILEPDTIQAVCGVDFRRNPY